MCIVVVILNIKSAYAIYFYSPTKSSISSSGSTISGCVLTFELPILDFHHKVHTLRFVALHKPSSFHYFSYLFVMFNFCYISISAKYFH